MTLDFRALADRLLVSSDTLVPQWLPGGKRQGKEWVCGDLSGGAGTSTSVNLLTGRWADFATGDAGGDLISLYAAIHELTMADAYRELDDAPQAPPTRPARPAKPQRTVVTPVPEAVADCDCIHPVFGPPSMCYTYWDGNGELLGYVARYDPPGQRKQVVPWTWDGTQWGMGQWPAPRPLYRLQELEARHADPVLIVEGEKSADAAARWAEPYVACTWPGGAQALARADWRPLHGRKILLWPDADETGVQAMQRLAAILAPHCAEIKVIDPAGMPDGWDAADAEFRTWAEARAWIAPRASVWRRSEPEPEPQTDQPQASEPEPPRTDQEDLELLQPAGWYKRIAFLISSADFFDIHRRKLIERKSFDSLYRHIDTRSVHPNADGACRRIRASDAYDENRIAMGGRTLSGLIYAPGQSVFVEHDGDSYGNTWCDGRVQGIEGDVSPWLEHAERMIPDPVEREHALNWMAYKVQNPKTKINHGVLHGGRQGSGKDSLWAPFLYAVGGRSGKNIKTVTTEEIQSSFTYHLESEVCVLNELREPALADRRALENRLKPLLAAPPDVLWVNQKNRHPYPALNRMSVLGFSNERISLSLSADDRRWMVLWSEAGLLPQAEAQRLWAWYEAGGMDYVAHHLRTRDVSAFRPGERPPLTDAKAVLLEGGLSPGEALLVEMMRGLRGPFRAGAIQGPWQQLVDGIQQENNQQRLTIQNLYVAAQHVGWLDLGKIKTSSLPTKKHVLCSPETLEKYQNNRAEIRRMLESLQPIATVHEFRRASGDE